MYRQAMKCSTTREVSIKCTNEEHLTTSAMFQQWHGVQKSVFTQMLEIVKGMSKHFNYTEIRNAYTIEYAGMPKSASGPGNRLKM